MKYKEYIEKLDNLNDEIEEGLIFELQEKPPANLHGEIMKSINRERKRVNFFNYRIYAPAVAAVLIFTVVINRPEILEKINFIKNAKITQKQSIAKIENTDPKDNSKNASAENSGPVNNTNTAIDNPKTQEVQGISPDNNTTSKGNNLNQQKNTAQNDQSKAPKKDNNKDIKIATKDNIDKADTVPADDALAPEKNTNEGKQLNVSDYLGMLFFKEPEINYEIVLDTNKSAILNFITENNEEKLSTSNSYKLSLEQFDSLDKLLTKYGIHKKAINESEATSKIVKIYLVNYHIVVDNSMPDIVKFIDDQGKSIKIAEDSYKITNEDMNDFNKLLTSAGIKKEFVSEVEDKYTIVKTLIINYEVSFNASQTTVTNFLNDTGKCKPIMDNIYRMNRESFSKFKELLNNSNVEIKVLNETSNQDILIKVNNI